MDAFIRDTIVRHAENLGYQLIDADECRLWFSIDGSENANHRDILKSFEDEQVPEDFVTNSADPRYIGAISVGWKSGPMMLMRLTAMGTHYQPMPENERRKMARFLVRLPTPEEIEGIDGLIRELTTGEKSAARNASKTSMFKASRKSGTNGTFGTNWKSLDPVGLSISSGQSV